jgi:uncharacterized protein YcbK (DUF882 family)
MIKHSRRDLLIASGAWLVFGGRALAQPRITRRLRLKNANTGETFDGPYCDSAGPLPNAIADLAVFFRDHRANKIGPVHIETLDFLADVMDAVGQNRATVLSAYRTQKTNALLRATIFGVAEKSQHLLGRAIDVALDQRLADARQAALDMKRGGVGWYPRSHFIHLDSGPVRAWEIKGLGLETTLADRATVYPKSPITNPVPEQRTPLARFSERGPSLARYVDATDRLKELRGDARRAFLMRHPR